MPVEKTDTFIQYNEISRILKRYGVSFNQAMLKNCLQVLTQTLMDIEVSQILDASRYERNSSRRAYRNGYRSTMWNTLIGDIELRVPKLRRGTYYPDQLLNDPRVSELLLQLITVCIVRGIDEDFVAETLKTLDLFEISPYEIHQVCDAIRSYVELSDTESSYNSEDNRSGERLLASYNRHRLLNDNTHTDSEFWKDFARRLIQAGLIVENEQSVLAIVNPYASLQLDDSACILDFADYIYPLYEEDYLRIA